MTFTYMYNYNPAGRVTGNRVLVQNSSPTPITMMDLKRVLHLEHPGPDDVDYLSSSGKNAPARRPSGPTFTYSFDAMNRITGLTETAWGYSGGVWTSGPYTVISTASYNAAGQLTSMGGIYSEARTYNSLMQLTAISGPVNETYNYTAGSNNGRVASVTNTATSETVTYQYDSLNRLIAANSNAGWYSV